MRFSIKDLGNLKYFLGMEIAHSTKGLFLNQRKCVLDLLEETGKMEIKHAETPTDNGSKLCLDGEVLTNVGMYQMLVGKLIYLTVTRPNIPYAVSLVSKFMHDPKKSHIIVVN